MVDCEIIDIEDAELKTENSYKQRCILIKRNPTDEEPDPEWIKCYFCNTIQTLINYTVDTTNDIVNITEEINCPVVSCMKRYHITNNGLVES